MCFQAFNQLEQTLHPIFSHLEARVQFALIKPYLLKQTHPSSQQCLSDFQTDTTLNKVHRILVVFRSEKAREDAHSCLS